MGVEDARAHSNFGASLAGAGRMDEAMAQYRLALQEMPNYPEAHNNMGTRWPPPAGSTKPSLITGRPWRATPAPPKSTTTWAPL